MLHRAGWLSTEEASRADAYRREHRCSAITALFDLGLTEETTLVRFLQSKLMIPLASASVLERIERVTLAQLPAELAWLHEVVPVSVDDVGNLTLAMADPTDGRAVDAIAGHSGAYIVRAVAPATALRKALVQHYGPRPEAPHHTPPPPHLPESAPRPVSPEEPAPLSPAALARVLPDIATSADRDEIIERMLDFLGAGFRRVILFINLKGQLRGRDARGSDLLVDAVTQVRIPTAGPSVFRDVIDHGYVHVGRWPTGRNIDKMFSAALGGIEGEALVLPVRLRDKIPLLVFADAAMDEDGDELPVGAATLQQLADVVSQALERLIYRRKSGDTLPPVG